LKKIFLMLLFTGAAISWIILIPVGLCRSFTEVRAVKAASTTVVNTVTCSGTLEAGKKYQIVLGYGVKIRKASFKIGDAVKKGDRLLDLDKTITMQLLSNAGAGTGTQTNAALPSLTESQKEALKQALSTGIISNSTYQSFIKQLTAQSSASSGLVSGNQKAPDAGKLFKNMEGQLKAPASGIISSIDDGTNGVSGAGSVLAEIIDFHSIQARIQVDEINLKYLKVGQGVELTGDGFYGGFSGVIRTIYPVARTVSAESGTQNMVDLLVHINKPDKRLLPGLSVNASIQVSKETGVVKLPYDAVRQDDDGTEYAFVIRNGKAVRENISTGEEDADCIEVTKGLRSGELVIDDENNSIANGTNVRIQ
jgi:RND family efflux transporter, MFP subunit